MPKGAMTLEKLAHMVKRGFDYVDRSFSAVDQRFNRVEGDVRQMKTGIQTMQVDIQEIKSNLNMTQNDVAAMRRRLDQTAEGYELLALERRVDVLERKTRIRKA